MQALAKLVVVLGALLFATPVFAAQWYISGFVSYNDPASPCNWQQGDICQTAVDAALGEGWSAEDISVRNTVARISTHNWALMQVGYSDYQPLVGKANIDMLPDFPFDAKMTSMTPATRNNLDNILTKWGIPTTCSSNAEGYRDFIRCLGRQIHPDWVETSWGN
jgi:hypothetical protein